MNSKLVSSLVYFYIITHLIETCYNIYLIFTIYNLYVIAKYMIIIQSFQIILLILFTLELFAIAKSNRTFFFFGRTESLTLSTRQRTYVNSFYWLALFTVIKLISNSCLFLYDNNITFAVSIIFITGSVIYNIFVFYVLFNSVIELRDSNDSLWCKLGCVTKPNTYVYVV